MPDSRAATARPLRILLLTTGLKLGGAEQQVAALARQFTALGQAVAVVSLTTGCEVALPGTATVVELGMRKTPMSMARALVQVHSFVHQWQPDVIHAHMVHANLLARVLACLTRTPPLVCTAHSVREGGRLRMLAYRFTDRWTQLTTHVSPQGRLAMIAAGAVPATRIASVPNGTDTSRYRPDPMLRQTGRAELDLRNDMRLIINVGRLVKEKAQDVLIDAFAQLDADPDVRLLIVGDGPQRAALEQRISDYGLWERIILTGVRRDVPALLNAADLFVLSSNIEGMPLAVGEALACGLPIVATDAAGVAELLGECGEIVARGDATALAAAMRRALANGPGDASIRSARRDRILKYFSLEAIARHWLDCYRRLLQTRQPPAVEDV